MRNFLLGIISISISAIGFSQPIGAPIPAQNGPGNSLKGSPDWGYLTKSAGDSCGAYFNNYVGLGKTTSALQEYMRTGDIVDDYYYAGRAQKFTVSQPVEVSGVEFYAYETSLLDSVMVITSLHTYQSSNDSLGPEITRDTVYVKHTAFTLILPNISVQSYFDTPIVMTTDYVIAMHSTQNEELVIITNDWTANDGNGESNSFALYQNPVYPADDGWYSGLGYLGADYDYLMNPYVKYDLFTPFSLLNDTICPDDINAGCVTNIQEGNFTNHMYNSQYASPTSHSRWLWGDGYQNVDIMSACHTYANPGTFNINFTDSLFRYNVNNPYCIVDVTQPIIALDLPIPSFTFVQDGLSADFTNTSSNTDSVWWNFGDLTSGTDANTPSHSYPSIGIFDVWLYAYNMCFVDSTMLQVITDDLSIGESEPTLEIFPNPANAHVIISGLNGESKIEVLNILGERVMVILTTEPQETLTVAALPTGTYFIRISQNENQITKKLIVKH